VGTYGIQQGTLSAGTNYALTYVGAHFAITQRPITVTAGAQTKVYGDSDPALSYQMTSGNLVSPDTINGALSRVAGENVGTYGIQQGTLSAGANYALTYVGANLAITQRPVTVTADAQTKVYGNVEPALSYQVTSGNLVSPDTIGGTLARVAGENAGTYAIYQGSLSAGANYNLTYVGANLVINRRDLLAQADNQSRVFGRTNPVFTISYSGFIAGDDVSKLVELPTATSLAETNSPVGLYAIELSGGSDTNYSLVLSNGTLTVTTAALTVSADNASRTYGTANPTFTASYSGFVNGEDSTALSGTLAFSTLAGAASPIGNYAITPSGLSSTNYTITFAEGSLTITPAALTVTADAQTKVYGDSDPALSYQLTSGSLFGPDAFSGGLSREAGENVGTYGIQQGTLSAGTNYALTYVGANLAITRRALVAQADNQSRVYGQTNPVFTISYTGFVNNDGVADLDTLPIASTIATETSSPGAYPITLTGGADNNYEFHLVDGTLTITAPTLVTLSFGADHTVLVGAGDNYVTYTIQASADLVHWDNIGSTTTDEHGHFEFQDTSAGNAAVRFYRTSLP
jgi:hypothetical protein